MEGRCAGACGDEISQERWAGNKHEREELKESIRRGRRKSIPSVGTEGHYTALHFSSRPRNDPRRWWGEEQVEREREREVWGIGLLGKAGSMLVKNISVTMPHGASMSDVYQQPRQHAWWPKCKEDNEPGGECIRFLASFLPYMCDPGAQNQS